MDGCIYVFVGCYRVAANMFRAVGWLLVNEEDALDGVCVGSGATGWCTVTGMMMSR